MSRTLGQQTDLATQFIQNQMNSKDGMKPMEFSVLYLIQRQLPNYWHRFFETNINMVPNDWYQCHAFIVKRNTYFFN